MAAVYNYTDVSFIRSFGNSTDLGGFATARLATNQHNLVLLNGTEYLVVTICYRQLTSLLNHLKPTSTLLSLSLILAQFASSNKSDAYITVRMACRKHPLFSRCVLLLLKIRFCNTVPYVSCYYNIMYTHLMHV